MAACKLERCFPVNSCPLPWLCSEKYDVDEDEDEDVGRCCPTSGGVFSDDGVRETVFGRLVPLVLGTRPAANWSALMFLPLLVDATKDDVDLGMGVPAPRTTDPVDAGLKRPS